ncbi:MAG: hypothetical protein ABJA94_12070 [Rhodoglobus sp.]
MRAVRMRGVTTGFVGVALAASLVLTGCSIIPTGARTGGGTGGSGSSGGSGGTTSTDPGTDTNLDAYQGIPASFPKDVPVISGDVPVGLDLGTGWTIVVKVSDSTAAWTDAGNKLKAAGFTAQTESSSADASFGDYINDKYEVQITGQKAPNYGPSVSYVVVLKG